MITAKIAQEIVQTKKFETTLHMCHVYDPQKKRLSFFMDHNSKLTLVGTRNKLLDIPCGETVTFLSKITARSKEDYETNLKIALQNYLRSTILEIHTQFPEDSEAIKEFFYSGDCNLGYPSTSIFPEFLTNIPNFHKWLSECFPKNAFTEYTGRIHEKIMIKCALFSGNLDVVANAKTHYEEQFSEQLAGQPFELMHVFYEKNKPPESLKTLLASEWPAPKKKWQKQTFDRHCEKLFLRNLGRLRAMSLIKSALLTNQKLAILLSNLILEHSQRPMRTQKPL